VQFFFIVMFCNTFYEACINALFLINSVLEGHCPAEFSSNPDHLSKLIKDFRITRKSQVSVFDQGQSLRNPALYGYL